MQPLSVTRIAHIKPERPDKRWLVDKLWADNAVGFIGGAPKSLKTWTALELALAVASGQPCLGRFEVRQRGPVLLFAAEDSPAAIRSRVTGIAHARGLDLDRLPLGLITEPSLRLDDLQCQHRIDATLAKIRPKLLILDPLVRLHAGDENSSAEVSAILGFLRNMQRKHHVAIVVVHHVRKTGASSPGQALRGSGDLYAWLDSALYLIHRKGKLLLAPQHRNRPSIAPMTVELRTHPTHLEIVGEVEEEQTNAIELFDARVAQAVTEHGPISRADLRATMRVRNETLGRALARLETANTLEQRDGTWRVPDSPAVGIRSSGTG